jgi:hypothetical protein
MNKIQTISLAILGGVEAVFSIATPILIAILWIKYSGMAGWSSWTLVTAGIISSAFRGIKIGFFKG